MRHKITNVCPFSHSHRLGGKDQLHLHASFFGRTFQVRCGCGARGGVYKTREQAIELWNTYRVGK